MGISQKDMTKVLDIFSKNGNSVTDRLKDIGLKAKSTWASSKLWILLSIICTLIFLSHGNLATIMDSLLYVTLGWMTLRTAEDIVKTIVEGGIKKHALTLFAKDGLTADEVDSLNDEVDD